MQATTPVLPRNVGDKMFLRANKYPMMSPRTPTTRPLSEATEIFDTDGDDDSEFEEAQAMAYQQPPSPRESVGSDDSRRRSQTTVSSYEEAPTPDSSSSRSRRRPFELQLKPVEGPKGPHLFRSSQISTDSSFDYALQMSPLLPKHPPPRTETAFSQNTVTPVSQQPAISFSIDALMNNPSDDFTSAEAAIRQWNPTQVIDWMVDTGIDESVIECFEKHDISGAVLLALQFDDLKEIGIHSFGKRHQLWDAISAVQGKEGIAPEPTPFQDTSRPCTTDTRRSPSCSRNACDTPIECDVPALEPTKSKKRRGRKAPKAPGPTTPMESVSIVAIEQLLPKPHTCAKGEDCAKWRKQQRELKLLHQENGIGRFPISPTKGGRIFVHGDPGNAATARNIVPREVERQREESYEPHSEVIPSIVASSDVFGPSQLPAFALHEGMLERIDKRDPQENVKQFLNFQHMQSPVSPMEDQYLDGTLTPIERPATSPPQRRAPEPLPLFPEEHVTPFHPQQTVLQPLQYNSGPHQHLKALPKLDIPRSASAAPAANYIKSPETSNMICRSTTASPGSVYRLGTPSSEMDVPVTFQDAGPIERDTSQSVPPSMQFREQQQLSRSHSRAQPWHRPSFALPAVKENEVFSPVSDTKSRPSLSSSRADSSNTASTRKSSTSSIDSTASTKAKDPAHHSPTTQQFGYGAECTHAGWMRKRKTKMLRHEWQDAHFRLKGTQLAMHSNARLSAAELDSFDVDKYAVACSTAPSSSKLSAAFKGLHIRSDSKGNADPAPFAFQLVPNREGAGAGGSAMGRKSAADGGKTHHFAVKTKDERIDWMRELMLAKALQQKGKGYEVEVYGGEQI
ncbi:hypothetical protein WHR41_02938 [Cladosporium halotolerans]|uniref:SAM and PH domain-containing protein n=1 Tax=Cladosporium halotolerans TaxID=1052096 RepID=A0AB34KU82_9PEZI